MIVRPDKILKDDEDFYADAISAGSLPHGTVIYDGKVVADTLQCAHHNGHFVHRKNRGRWQCLKCGGPVCGMPRCLANCTPFEKRLEEYEAGLRSSL